MTTSDNTVNARSYKSGQRNMLYGLFGLLKSLPSTSTARVIGNQLLRSGTSVGANYRAACRSRSKIEFAAKIGVVD